MPLPRNLAGDHCEAFLFDEKQPSAQVPAKPSVYPFPVAQEIWKNLPFPKSICIFGNACPVSESEQDPSKMKSLIESCPVSKLMGCPFFLLKFDEFASFAECKDVEIFDFAAPDGRQFEKDADTIIKNFEKMRNYHRAPIVVLGHDEGQEMLAKEGLPCAGIVGNLKKIGSKLRADFADVPKKIADLINLGAYRFISSEIYKNLFVNGEYIGPVLRRVALLGADVPKIKGLDDILARYDDKTSEIQIWLKKGDSSNMKKQTFKLKNPAGSFAKGDKITAGEANGIVDSIDGNTLIINTESEKEFSSSNKVVGPNGSAELEETYPFPNKSAEPSTDTPPPVAASELQVTTPIIPATQAPVISAAQFAEMQRQISEKDKQILDLRKHSEQQAGSITAIEDQLKKERANKEIERRLNHAREVANFCENLKKSPYNMAPALIDDSGFRTMLMALDWQRPLKFSENESEKTAFEKFSEIISGFANAARKGTLIVPIDNLPPTDQNTDSLIGVDQDQLGMDIKITKFSEQNKCSYEEAFKLLNESGDLYK